MEEKTPDNFIEIFQLLLIKYQDDISRKERLENKALGYLTSVSIILAVSTAILIFYISLYKNALNWHDSFLVLAYFGHLYFSVWTFVLLFKRYTEKDAFFVDLQQLSDNGDSDKQTFLGGLNQTLWGAQDKNAELIEELKNDIGTCRTFLSITFGMFVLFLVVFMVLFIGALTGLF
jgi:hypothetical protein